MYAAGGNAQAARLAGVRVDRTRILTFVISGTAAGLAGVLDTSNGLSASVQPTSNDNLTFTVLAGVVIGGTSILGGEGAVWRSVVGVLFIALIYNGWDLLATTRSGRVDRIRILTFAISGMAAGLAGVIDTAKVLTAQATTNDTLTFTVLAAIVVGGTSILGGEGAVWRSVVGVLFIALIGNGYVLLALDPLYQQITLGVLLLARRRARRVSRAACCGRERRSSSCLGRRSRARRSTSVHSALNERERSFRC